jgi:Phosphatidylinositol 3- and 4-kinase
MRLLALLLAASTLVAAQEATTSAPPWIGSADAIAEYIRTASVQKLENIPIGVTKPQRAILAPGGPVGSVVVKDLPPGRKGGYWESYRSEIAAYELDRLLDLNMVPPTVEKRVKGTMMSAQMFVERCIWLKELKGQQPPDVEAWNRQVHRHRAFDNLIANIDRNAGNLLVYRTPDWHLVLVDHSRCFTTTKKLPFAMTRIDRPLFERLKALDKPTLEARLGRLVDGIDAMLARRDAIVRHFEQLAAVKGETVFTP